MELIKGKGVKLSFRYHLMKPIKNKFIDIEFIESDVEEDPFIFK